MQGYAPATTTAKTPGVEPRRYGTLCNNGGGQGLAATAGRINNM